MEGDGTQTGNVMVKDISGGSGSSFPWILKSEDRSTSVL